MEKFQFRHIEVEAATLEHARNLVAIEWFRHIHRDDEIANDPTPEEIVLILEDIDQDAETVTRIVNATAIDFFRQNQAAVDFIKLSPEGQATQIDGMTTAQLKNVVKYLAVAVSAAVRREYL